MTHINLVLACSESGLALGLVKSTTLWLLPRPVRESVVRGWREGWRVAVGRQISTPALYSEIQSGVMTLSHPCFLSALSY